MTVDGPDGWCMFSYLVTVLIVNSRWSQNLFELFQITKAENPEPWRREINSRSCSFLCRAKHIASTRLFSGKRLTMKEDIPH